VKFSEAMLKGFEMVGGRQTKGQFCIGKPSSPRAVCVHGAASLAVTGWADDWHYLPFERFCQVWGMTPLDANDIGLPWEHIYGMAVAAGV
jgi:hypothetical protein